MSAAADQRQRPWAGQPLRSVVLPSHWLAEAGAPYLVWVPAASTDIRVLFARVRREQQQARPVRLARGAK